MTAKKPPEALKPRKLQKALEPFVRRGNGPGYGGPAKGNDGRAAKAATFVDGNQAASGPRSTEKADRIQWYRNQLIGLAEATDQPGMVRYNVVKHLWERDDPPIAKSEISGPDGAALLPVLNVTINRD